MNKTKILKITTRTKISVSANSYDISKDNRLLIPYTDNFWIGFINSSKEIVVNPKYLMYYDDCCSINEYIRVALPYLYGGKEKSCLLTVNNLRPLWGLIDYTGKEILPCNYFALLSTIDNKNLFVAENRDYHWGVIDARGNEIVPFGKYSYIWEYEKGQAKAKIKSVSSNKEKIVFIDENGREI